MIITSLLRASPDFAPEHVYWLADQVKKHFPEHDYLPFSNVRLKIPYHPLEGNLPNWWGKMDMLRYPTDEPMLVLDLDTVILKSVAVPTDRPYVARQVARDKGSFCAMMLWTPEFREKVAKHFFVNPRRFMVEANGDDQKYYDRYWAGEMSYFQDVIPDALTSYKLSVQYYGLRPANAFVLFHGQPRPWTVDEPWIPKLA